MDAEAQLSEIRIPCGFRRGGSTRLPSRGKTVYGFLPLGLSQPAFFQFPYDVVNRRQYPSVYVSQLPFRHSGGGNHIICFSVPAFLPVHLPIGRILWSF